MKTNEQYCWELVNGKLVSVKDPIPTDTSDTDSDFYALLATAGYLSEISSEIERTPSNAAIVIYKNDKPENGNPLFYIDVLGYRTGIASLIARDFAQLAETLNSLAGLLSLIQMDQASVIARE
ncbi:hypothetical protein [Limnohabitans sp.]|uniref:hypothetical protein n=1 Tax=Limnohabitans sp. TaxID=1907725 RepID=UPI00286F728E|nr:hypothetical protein [Limnohabitans sp.]